MKIKNIIISAMLLASAGVGASANGKATRHVIVFYISGGQCLQGSAETVCPFIGFAGCVVPVAPLTGLTPIFRQVYASRTIDPNTGTFECIDPYSESEPDEN